MSDLVNIVTAIMILLFSALSVIISVKTIRCTPCPHWVHYWRVGAGLATIITYGYAVITVLMTGGDFVVIRTLGRPMVILLVSTLLMSAYIDYERGRRK